MADAKCSKILKSSNFMLTHTCEQLNAQTQTKEDVYGPPSEGLRLSNTRGLPNGVWRNVAPFETPRVKITSLYADFAFNAGFTSVAIPGGLG